MTTTIPGGGPSYPHQASWGHVSTFFSQTETCALWVPVFRSSTNCVEEFGLHSIEKCRSKLPLAGLWSVAESFNAWRKRHITAERLKLPIAMRGHLAEHCWKWRWWGRTNNIGKRKKGISGNAGCGEVVTDACFSANKHSTTLPLNVSGQEVRCICLLS